MFFKLFQGNRAQRRPAALHCSSRLFSAFFTIHIDLLISKINVSKEVMSIFTSTKIAPTKASMGIIQTFLTLCYSIIGKTLMRFFQPWLIVARAIIVQQSKFIQKCSLWALCHVTFTVSICQSA